MARSGWDEVAAFLASSHAAIDLPDSEKGIRAVAVLAAHAAVPSRCSKPLGILAPRPGSESGSIGSKVSVRLT